MNVRENASWMPVPKVGGWMQDIAFMKTHLLRYFVVLAEERHFGRAAQLLPLEQGLAFEAAAYDALVQTPQAQGLRPHGCPAPRPTGRSAPG